MKEELYENVAQVLEKIDETNPWAVFVFLICVAALLVLERLVPLVPWAVVVAAFGILFGTPFSCRSLIP